MREKEKRWEKKKNTDMKREDKGRWDRLIVWWGERERETDRQTDRQREKSQGQKINI